MGKVNSGNGTLLNHPRPRIYGEETGRPRNGGRSVPPCAVENYDRFLRKREVPCGTYIFTDIERLTPWELRVVAEAYHALAADERCRVLNDPARVMTRYELLRNLREEGINDFDVIRADERRWPARYPVFLRHEQDHGRPLSADLLHNREELEAALKKAQEQYVPPRPSHRGIRGRGL